MAEGVRVGRRARRPGRRGAGTENAGQRPRPAQGAGAARGRRRRLRGAAERDDRLRGADDQERQRDRPARLQLRRALQRARWRRSSARRWPRRGCRRTRSCCSAGGGHEELAELATQEGLVDLLIPRGGEGLKEAIKEVATVPVMYAAAGNCHVYVHADADLEMARRIAVNAKVQRPGVCNAAETLLIDAAIADALRAGGPRRPRRGRGRAGRRRARPRRRRRGRGRRRRPTRTGTPSTSALKMAVAVVDSVEDAIEHVNAPRHRPLGGDRHRLRGGGRGVRRRGRRRRRLRQRLDPLHRRLRVRDGRRDRQLDPEAARPRPDRDARADDLQVRRRAATARCVSSARRRGDRRARVGLQPAAPRPPGARPGGALAARPRRGGPRPDRRGAAQADRRRPRAGGCGWR